MVSGYWRRPVSVLPAADSLLAPGAFPVHRPRLEAALFHPALDLVFREPDNPDMRDESALHVAKNRLAVNP